MAQQQLRCYGEELREHFDVYRTFRPFGNKFDSLHDKDIPLLRTNISCIDDSMIGLMPSDLLVVAAGTGCGKTSIGLNIASNCAIYGKKVVFFSLESYDPEMEDRIKFNKICSVYYSNGGVSPLRFKEWATGKYPELLDIERKIIDEGINENLRNNLFMRYRNRNESYTVGQFEIDLERIRSREDIDLVVIDHLHYFYMGEDKTENESLSRTVKQIRDVCLLYNIPIILISHLRKRDKYVSSLCPDLSEIHGSSEITKNATGVITMASAFDIPQPKPHLFPTYFRICKDRFESTSKRYLLCGLYNAKTGLYEREYVMYDLKKDGSTRENVNHVPSWAKHGLKYFITEHKIEVSRKDLE